MVEEYQEMKMNKRNGKVISVTKIHNVVENMKELDEESLLQYAGRCAIHHHCGLIKSEKRYPGHIILGTLNVGCTKDYLYIEGPYLCGAEGMKESLLKSHKIMGFEYKGRWPSFQDIVPSIEASLYVFDSEEEGQRTIETILDDLASVCIE